MHCSNCGKPVAPGAKFCAGCGAAVVSAPPDESVGRVDPVAATAGAGPTSSEAPSYEAAGASATSSTGLLDRVRGILLAPKVEWPAIAREPVTSAGLLQRYVLPLAAFAAVVSFVHVSLIGVSVPFVGTIRTPIAGGLVNAALTAVMGVIGVCIVAAVINLLAPRFAGVKDWHQALKTSAYSLTPALVGSVFGLLPTLGTLLGFLAALYGIYVLYLGLPVVMRSPRERAGTYTASVVICTIIVGILLGVVSAAVGFSSNRLFSAISPTVSREAQREQGAAAVANVIGNALGSDPHAKSDIASALSNLAKAGEQAQASASSSTAGAAAHAATEDSAIPSEAPGNGSAAAEAQQNALGAAGGLLTALGGALGGAHPKQPVDFHKLRDALPETVLNLPRGHVEAASKQAFGVKAASAKAQYGGNGAPTIDIEISDLSGIAALADFATGLPATESSESDTGFEKDVSIGGRSAHEKFDTASKRGEVSTLIAKRFSVDVTGYGMTMADLEKALVQVNLSALEAMKDEGAAPR